MNPFAYPCEIMKLQEIFKTPTMAKLLDLLLAKPSATYLQSHITGRLGIDKATMRRAIERLQALGLIDVDVDPAGVHLKAITFNGDSKAGRALLKLHRTIRKI